MFSCSLSLCKDLSPRLLCQNNRPDTVISWLGNFYQTPTNSSVALSRSSRSQRSDVECGVVPATHPECRQVYMRSKVFKPWVWLLLLNVEPCGSLGSQFTATAWGSAIFLPLYHLFYGSFFFFFLSCHLVSWEASSCASPSFLSAGVWGRRLPVAMGTLSHFRWGDVWLGGWYGGGGGQG